MPSSTRVTRGPPNHISALDANNPGTVAAADYSSQAGSYYADDDSVVSSNVSAADADDVGDADDGGGTGNPEVVTLTREVITDLENANRNHNQPPDERTNVSGIMPRSPRECYGIACIACLLMLMVVLGTGLGLGFYFTSQQNSEENPPAKDVRAGVSPTGAPTNGPPTWPSYAPTPSPGDNSSALPTQVWTPLSGDDLASTIEYHVMSQEISDITSFSALAGEGDPTTASSQDRARDFLVYDDYLPESMNDEEDEPDGTDDDPLVIPNDERPDRQRRPYLTTMSPAYRVTQRFAAAVLYYATDGDNWETNRLWLEPGVHECDWVGVACEAMTIPAVTLAEAAESPNEMPRHDDGSFDEATERMIVAIDLPENGVGGTLPRELAALPYLGRLGLWSNVVGGTLPTQLGGLTRLTSLHLDDNALVGNVPRTIGEMTGLTDLLLDFNEGVVGRIPVEIGNLPNLERLRLSNMSLRGPLPAALGNLANLVELSVKNNRLSRSLPEELGNLVHLESLILSGNAFVGDIPMSWSNMTGLKKLEIHIDQLTSDMDERLCSSRNGPAGPRSGHIGPLEVLVAGCEGNETRVACSCCAGGLTSCIP